MNEEELKKSIRQIDSDAYVLKNKLMHHFDEKYGTNLMKDDADNLSFFDIIISAKHVDPAYLYADIKKIAGHGVTNEQKNILYAIFPFFSNGDSYGDFDDMISAIETAIEHTGDKNVFSAQIIAYNGRNAAAYTTYYRRPFRILKMQRIGEEELQAILVQNGAVLILEVVDSEDKLPAH